MAEAPDTHAGKRLPTAEQLARTWAAGRRRHQLRADGPQDDRGLPRAAWPHDLLRGSARRDLRPRGAAARRRRAGRMPTSPRPARSSSTLAVLGQRARPLGEPREPGGSPRCRERWPPATPRALQERTRQEQEEVTRVGVRRAHRGRAGAVGQRGPLPGGVRRGAHRDRAGRHGGPHPRGQPGDVRDARPHARGAVAAGRSGRSSTPRTCPGCGTGPRSCSPASATTCGWRRPTSGRTAPRCGPTSVLSLIRDPHGSPQYMVAMMENITERHRLQTRLQHQALHDPLTGPAQPHPVLRAARRRAARRDAGRASATSTSTGSRRSTTPSATTRATRCCTRSRRPRRRRARRRAPGGAHGRRRVRRAGRRDRRRGPTTRCAGWRGRRWRPSGARCGSTSTRSSCPRASAWCAPTAATTPPS